MTYGDTTWLVVIVIVVVALVELPSVVRIIVGDAFGCLGGVIFLRETQ